MTLLANAWRATPAATGARWSNGLWVRQPHLHLVSRKVAALAEGPIRLLVSLPPQHGKSELVSHWTPVWFLANWPTRRVGLASYAAEFAANWGRKARDTIMATPELGVGVRQDLSGASLWELTEGGGMMTAGVGGPFTGHGFDLLIIDDPLKNRQEANSAAVRRHLWEWWQSVARTRLRPGGSIIVVMTRWHEDDLLGQLLASVTDERDDWRDRWEHIKLPALAEPDDPLGRSEGEPLWPERYDAMELAATRLDIGPQEWAGLYQQRPSQQGGDIFKLGWWVRADSPEPDGRLVFQFWDTAFKTGEQNDYSVCCTIATADNGYVVLDVWRRRVEFPDLLRAMQDQAEMYKPSHIFVEDAASGQSVVQSLRRETRLPVLPVKPLGDKVLRAHRMTGTVEARKVMLPKAASWLPDFLEEMSAFPNGAYDDQMDAFVGCLEQQIQRPGGIGGFYL